MTREKPAPSGKDTMHYWLARTLRERREARKLSVSQITMLIPGRDPAKRLDESQLSRFENALSWPRNIDEIVAAYAAACGIEDGRKLWADALKHWRVQGTAPALGHLEISPQVRSVLLAQEAKQRSRPYDAESPSKPTSSHRRRAEP